MSSTHPKKPTADVDPSDGIFKDDPALTPERARQDAIDDGLDPDAAAERIRDMVKKAQASKAVSVKSDAPRKV